MTTIKFSSQKLKVTLEYDEPPVLFVSKVTFSTDEKNWVRSLITLNFTIKISAFNSKKELLFSNQEILHLPITPNHIQPVFEINQYFRKSQPARIHGTIQKWEAEIELNNISFKKGESITLEFMDREYIVKRVDDWEKRVKTFIQQLSTWVLSDTSLQIRPGRKSHMHEGLMKDFDVPVRQLETADILRANKLIMAVKPFGLWIMGANGRIDLMTATRNIILVDEAEHFQKPRWKVFLNNNKEQGSEFDRQTFNQIVNP